MLPRQGVIAAPPDTQTQTQGGCQHKKTKKHGPDERTDQNSRKRTKQNGDKQSITAEFTTLFIILLKELSEDFNSIKKIQLEMKDSLTEIKNNLQGNNSRVDEAQNQINYLEHREPKKHQSEQEKRIKKPEDSVSSLWDNFNRSDIRIIGVPEGEEKEQETGNLFEKIMKENFPNLVKETDMQVQENTESQTRWIQRGPLQDTS